MSAELLYARLPSLLHTVLDGSKKKATAKLPIKCVLNREKASYSVFVFLRRTKVPTEHYDNIS